MFAVMIILKHSVVSPLETVGIIPSGDILTNFGSTETLICITLAGPDNMYEWIKQGTGVVSTDSTLTLSMITGSDGSLYTCSVTNAAGSDVATALLIGMLLRILFSSLLVICNI